MIGIVHLLLLLQMTGKHATEISRGADIPYLGIGSCKSSNDNSEKGFKGDPSLIAADRGTSRPQSGAWRCLLIPA